jgi:N-acetylmuramoyl-L-alanine amidase
MRASINTTLNYSYNFDLKKRKKKQIKFIIFHYTGMKKEIDAINKLINQNSKVSSHYFIKKNGEILTMVPDLYKAWHAGISHGKIISL